MTQEIFGNADPASPAVNKPTVSAKDIRIKPAERSSDEEPSKDNTDRSPLLDALWRSTDRRHFLGVLDRETNHFRNIPIEDPADVVAHVQRLSVQNVELYFACAEFETANSRTAANAAGAHGFWLDIDCGQAKAVSGIGYPTIEEAEAAVHLFCDEVGLPSPTHLVLSGTGLHAYWVLEEIVPRDVWREYAQKLKALTRARGLLADDSRTSDIASVLRIPGTLNRKTTPPRPVEMKYASETPVSTAHMLDAIDEATARFLSPQTEKTPARPSASTPTNPLAQPDLARGASAMTVLDPDCEEKTWKLRRLAPLARIAKEFPEIADQCRQLARDWSSGALRGIPSKAWRTPGSTNGRTGEEIFEEVWNRFLDDTYAGEQTTLATIYHDAIQAGWADPDQFKPVSTDTETKSSTSGLAEAECDLDPLAYVQRQYALLSISGRICVLDAKSLNKESVSGPTGTLHLFNRSDGGLLIARAIKARFPNEDPSPIVREFFTHPNTVCYRGIEFNPSGTTPGFLNLFVGPTATPVQGDWALIRDFLLNVICNGDEATFQYLIRLVAHALQHPAEKPGVVVVLIGGEGIGKGTVGRILQWVWGATYLQVHNMDAITGTFNGSLERVFIVFLDEALFVGDRRATDALKSLVTEPVIQVNEKHQPARQIRSYHRFFVATNADHWKYTAKDDRRDFVLRVSEDRKGDHAYWAALHHAIESGAVEAMVYDLMAMDLTGFNVRHKPDTPELLAQKLQSLEAIPRWWYDCLQAGSIDDDDWPEFIGTATAIEDIVGFAGNKLYRKPAPLDLVRTMRQLCPSIVLKQRKAGSHRQRGLVIPPLEQARREFEQYIGGTIAWDV